MTGILITVRIKLLFLADRLAWGRAWHKALALRCFWFGSDRNLTKRRSRRGCSKHTHRVPSGKVFYPGRCRLTKNGKHNKSGRYIKFVSYNMEFTLNSIDSVVSTTPTSPREGVGPFFFFFFVSLSSRSRSGGLSSHLFTASLFPRLCLTRANFDRTWRWCKAVVDWLQIRHCSLASPSRNRRGCICMDGPSRPN